MSIKDLYLELFSYPDSPKCYRDLRDYYQHVNMLTEADAFAHLLQIRFKEIPKLHVNDPFTNQEQRENHSSCS